mgnify:CR=1 FL=1
MRLMTLVAASGLVAAGFLGGCATDSDLGLTTASLAPTENAKKTSVHPACIALAAKISDARAEGTPDRFAKVATAENKSRIVSIKRDSLAKVAELDALNKQFQARCSTISTAAAPMPKPMTTTAAPAATETKAAATTAANTATKTADAAATRVTTRPVATQPIVATPQSN